MKWEIVEFVNGSSCGLREYFETETDDVNLAVKELFECLDYEGLIGQMADVEMTLDNDCINISYTDDDGNRCEDCFGLE